MIQIDIPIPKHCYDCPICYDGYLCPIVGKHMDFTICDIQRMDFCPLEVAPDVKIGKWTTERTQEHDGEWYCSECGYEPIVMSDDMKYCPGCGRRMTIPEPPKEESK